MAFVSLGFAFRSFLAAIARRRVCLHELRIRVLLRVTVEAIQKFVVIHEKIRSQNALRIEFFKEIGGSFGGLAHWILRPELLIFGESSARTFEIQTI